MLAGQAIKLCRKVRRMTQTHLAEVSGLSVAHISLVEAGRREITLDSFQKVCKTLGIPPFLAIFAVEKCKMSQELSEKMAFLWLEYARG